LFTNHVVRDFRAFTVRDRQSIRRAQSFRKISEIADDLSRADASEFRLDIFGIVKECYFACVNDEQSVRAIAASIEKLSFGDFHHTTSVFLELFDFGSGFAGESRLMFPLACLSLVAF